MKKTKAYYFSNKDKKLRFGDNRQIRKGRTHKVKGDIVLCENGLHASIEPLDALGYASDSYLWIVELSGTIVPCSDKLVASERTYLKGFNADKLLREFAKRQALINIHKIKTYISDKKYKDVVRFLNGDEGLKTAAWSAARSAESAARSAARLAARSAESAAWSAESAAASAARLAAESAAMSAAMSAAESTAESAAWSAESAAWSAESAAWSAANKMLKQMIKEATQ